MPYKSLISAARLIIKNAVSKETPEQDPQQPNSRSAEGKEELKRKRNKMKERLFAAKQAKAHLNSELTELRRSHYELQRSYYLSGAAKKLDLRQVKGFSEIASQVMSEGNCGMNFDRLYTLWQAVQAAPADLPMVEVGVYRGGSAKFISETLHRAGRSPRFYVCDTFSGHPRIDSEIDNEYHNSRKFGDTSLESVTNYLAGHPNLEVVVGDIFETSDRLPQGPYGFVHIDVDVYPATDFCLRFFAPRLAPGAVIVIDDYGFVTCPGAKKAVDDFIAETLSFRLFHLLTGQALLFRA